MQKKIIGYRATFSYTNELLLEDNLDWLPDWLEGKTPREIAEELTLEMAELDGNTIRDNTEIVAIYEDGEEVKL
jgi:hypothetical protein